ncbi:MAG: glycosyltransferase family 39 protein [Actinomycetota bacterium]|nr:glycosyltransferase family 39 protein [Actinomycetota bacterium]
MRVARLGVWAYLSLLVLVSVWLRTRGLHTFYWIDEGLSVGIASHPLTHIPSLLQQDGSPPLYYMLLHVWMTLFGRGEVATHEFSLLSGLLTIPVSYWAGASLFSRRAGVVCAALAAGAPYLTTYAQETRMYALLALLSIVVCASFVHGFVLRHRRQLPVFVVGLTAALYTHNWALFLGITAVAAWMICIWSAPVAERRALWRDGVIAFGAVAVLYAPWLPTLIYQARHTGAPWDLPPIIWSISQGLYSLVGGRGAAVALLLAGGSGLVALMRVSPLRGVAALRDEADPQRRLLAAGTLIVMGFGTLAIGFLYSKITPAWAIRYLGVVVGPLILLFGLGLSRAGRLGIVALALVASFWLLDPVSTSRSAKSNVGRVAPSTRAQLGRGGLVLSTQPEEVPTLAYYLPEVSRFGTPLGRVSDPRVVDWRGALKRLEASSVSRVLMPMVNSMRPGQHILLVVPTNSLDTPLWLDLIGRYSVTWSRALERDRALKLISSTARGSGASGSGVRAMLFVVRGRKA